MQKKLLILSAILVFISTVLYAFMSIRNTKEVRESEADPQVQDGTDTPLFQNNIPVSPLVVPVISPEVEQKITTLKGSWEDLQGGFYIVKNVPALKAPSMIPDYSINYDANARVFTVLLYKDSLLENRQKAGDDIMSILGTTPEETCKLDVQVFIPDSVNVDYANTNLRLPFCAGFTDLKGVSADNGVSNIDPSEKESDVSL